MSQKLEYAFSFSTSKEKTLFSENLLKQKNISQKYWFYVKINKRKKSTKVDFFLTVHTQTLLSVYKNKQLVFSNGFKKTLEQFQTISVKQEPHVTTV